MSIPEIGRRSSRPLSLAPPGFKSCTFEDEALNRLFATTPTRLPEDKDLARELEFRAPFFSANLGVFEDPSARFHWHIARFVNQEAEESPND